MRSNVSIDGDKIATRRVRADDWVTRTLTHVHARLVICGFALLLTSSYLALGGTGDDDFHAVAVRTDPHLRGVQRAPWDLFSFAQPATNHALMEEGLVPWWTDPELVIAFYRPLSSCSAWIDHTFWPDRPALMHLHSMLWFALLLGSVTLVYRSFSLSARHTTLALFLYAVDDARAIPVAWLAQRNALIALAPAFLSLVAHQRFCQSGRARYALLGSLALLLGLQGGETALCVCGYLLAYALVLDQGTLRARLTRLWPYLAVVLMWRLGYLWLERGALHSGSYVDLGRDPLQFLRLASVRLPVLLLGQFALPFADGWEAYPLIAPWLRPAVLCFAALVLGWLVYLLRPLLATQRLLRFWLLGSLLATIPVCSVFPEDRMLTATSLGAAPVLAAFVLSLLDASYPRRTPAVVGSAGILLLIHGLFAPLTLPLRSFDIYAMERLMRHADKSLPEGPAARRQTVVLINPPIDIFAIFFPLYREARQLELPQRFRWLATGECDLQVERVDAQSLKLRPSLGYLASASQLMFRRADRRFAPDHELRLDGVSYRVTALTDDGRPAELLVHFDRALESPELRWLQWGKHEYVPFTPPPIGTRVTVPKVDLAALFEDPAS